MRCFRFLPASSCPAFLPAVRWVTLISLMENAPLKGLFEKKRKCRERNEQRPINFPLSYPFDGKNRAVVFVPGQRVRLSSLSKEKSLKAISAPWFAGRNIIYLTNCSRYWEFLARCANSTFLRRYLFLFLEGNVNIEGKSWLFSQFAQHSLKRKNNGIIFSWKNGEAITRCERAFESRDRFISRAKLIHHLVNERRQREQARGAKKKYTAKRCYERWGGNTKMIAFEIGEKGWRIERRVKNISPGYVLSREESNF